MGKTNRRGVSVSALAVSTLGILIAAGINAVLPDSSYALMMGISMFGAMFTWLMVIISHLFFRKNGWRRAGANCR
ncbi:hypothetical protein ACI7RC_27205 [Brevibacillus sp. B_LB10_24]|uniref:hypothetical protein n=1 Tax=Brevibacillus sp. B_LB10_24 TaxID=3380645 RepID=UPI0038BDB279